MLSEWDLAAFSLLRWELLVLELFWEPLLLPFGKAYNR